VSRKTRTTSSTTKPSALNFLKVDAGNISPAKGREHFQNTDLQRDAMRVFYCRRLGARRDTTRIRPQGMAHPGAVPSPRSVPARLARRRLVAGPIPAALFRTGLQYPKVN
jgi:hypothetical protein